MVNWLEYYELSYAIVLTKSDKISATKMERQVYRTSKIVSNDELCKDFIPFSAINGEGKDIVMKLIDESLAS
jgi:GTP-binding protein EngB required for normal cell division